MFYEERVVAFIDILGFKSSIDKSATDKKEFKRIITALNDLKDLFSDTEENDNDYDGIDFSDIDTQIIQVSDSLIISRLINEEAGIFHMLQDCSFATHMLIENGFLCRGSIKYGSMYHKGTTVFGPAFVEAVETEKKISLPIITFNKDILDIVRLYPASANKPIVEWEINFILEDCIKLNKNEYYLDYFTDYGRRTGRDASKHYTKLRNIIINGLKMTKNSKAYSKLLWAKEQFNLNSRFHQIDIIP